jgi:putative transposase
MSRFEPTDAEVMQAFQFALDPSDGQRAMVNRQFGGRRFAYNWTVAALKGDIDRFRADGSETEPPSHFAMRRRWNVAKHAEAVDRETGDVWWPEVSKEAFSNGVKDAVDGYWRWQQSRQGKIAGRRVGFPRFKKRGRDQDRYTITTGSFGLVDRRHVKIPKVGVVRLHENARRLHRLIEAGRARVLAMTVRRHGDRILVALRVAVIRPQRHHKPTMPDSCVVSMSGCAAWQPSLTATATSSRSPTTRHRSRRHSVSCDGCAVSRPDAHPARRGIG